MFFIYSFVNKSKLYATTGAASEQTIERLQSVMGDRIKFKLVTDTKGAKWITFSKTHLEKAIAALPRHLGGVTVIKEYSNQQVCTSSCQGAKKDLCECSCLGQFHKGGEGHWINPVGDLLIKNETTTATYVYN